MNIKKVANGYILSIDDGEGHFEEYIYEDTIEGLKYLLSDVATNLGDSGSRHDDKRIYVVIAPGDKSNKFLSKHAKFLFGD